MADLRFSRGPLPALTLGLLGTVFAVAPSLSQEAAAAGDEELTEVIVTGSRIARAEIDSSVPIQVVTADSLDAQGSQNVVDVLQELPSFGTSGFSRANTNFASFGNGISTLNLRNADDKRTLVLINGRRAVSGVGGSSTVDINNIPTDLIKDIQIITGGASAVYGSEAIAGVVNFVLQDDFEGVSFRGQTGQTGESDNQRHLFAFTAGTNIGERGNIVANLQWDKDAGLRSKNRAISANDVPFRSGYTPQGRFFSDNSSDWTYNSSNQLINWRGSNVDGFNRNAERYISVPVARSLLTVLAKYDFNDSVQGFFEGSHSDVKSNSRLEPLATDNSDAVLPDGTVSGGLTLDNPFIPTTIRNEMLAAGDTTLFFLKRMNGVFDRSNRNEREYQRLVAGLRGKVFDWDWDVYVNASKTRDATKSETGLRDRYYYALDVIADPMGGAPICRDAAARANGCVPFNVFGFNSVSSAAAAYLTNNGEAFDTYDATIQQKVVGGNLVGEAFSMPAGPVKIATGFEHRQETSSEVFSADTQAGNTMGNALTNTVGRYSVTEVYLESIVPLLADASGAKSLDLEAAVRAGHYSTVGSVFSWKGGLTWAPVDSLRVRAVYASATRAPNIGELFAGQSQTFPTGLTDPCEGVTATSAGAVATYCRSLPGVLTNIAGNAGVFTYDDNRDRQSIEGFDGGNTNLKQETAKTITAGIVWTPEFAPRFSLSVDWFDIKINDAIALVPRQFIIDQCVTSLGTSSLCSFITREGGAPLRPRSPGTIWQVNSGPVNSASIETAGVDVAARWAHTFDNGHVFNASLAYTYLDKLTLQPLAGEPVQDNKGQLNGDGRLGAGFEHRANLSLGYKIGSARATWTARYQSAIKDTLEANGPLLSPAENNVSAYMYHDMQVRYGFGAEERFNVHVGVDNVFDKKPPPINQNGASNITGTETAAESYDPIGRYIYAGFDLKF
jgi:outer membrane receptor protein involved in Fe transport